jgi:hypothetical protein
MEWREKMTHTQLRERKAKKHINSIDSYMCLSIDGTFMLIDDVFPYATKFETDMHWSR